VTVVDDFTGGDDRSRWLYTAITRATEAVRIVTRGYFTQAEAQFRTSYIHGVPSQAMKA
jgi:hypothetical protein